MEIGGKKVGVIQSSGSGTESVVQNLILPTVLGAQSSLFTGDANVSYGFDMPKGPGGLTPALGLSYSSGSVADFAVGSGMGYKAGNRFFQQAGQFGFGWNLTGTGSIQKVRDSQDQNIVTNLLDLAGTSYKLIANGDGTWETSPKSNLKISHRGCVQDTKAEGLGVWTVVDTNGTTYFFGAEAGSDCTLVTAGNQHLSVAWRFKEHKKNKFSNLEAYKSMLRLVRDIHGNEIHYNYRQGEWKNIESCLENNQYPTDLTTGSAANNGFYKYTNAIYLDSITYGSNNEFQVRISYEDRPDWRIEYGGTSEIPAWKYACNQNYFSRQRADQVQILKNGNQYALYYLRYDENDKKFLDGGTDTDPQKQVGHSRLIGIKRFGTGSESLPETTYTYTSSVPNEVLIQKVDNGSGGIITFSYDKIHHTRCRIDKVYNHAPNSCAPYDQFKDNRLTVISKEVQDQVTNKKFTANYEYADGLAFYLTDECEYSECNKYDGYEFLGYKTALEKTTKNDSSDIAKITRLQFFQSNESTNCFNPSAKKGKPSLSQVLDANGTLIGGSVLSETRTNYRGVPFAEPGCVPSKDAYLSLKLPAIFPSDATSITNGVTAKVAYEYDSFGNTTLVENQGFPSAGDERYSVTRYATDKSGKNLISKPYLSIASKDRNGTRPLSMTKTYYDNSTILGEIPSGGKGDATKVESGANKTPKNGSALDDVENEAEVLGIFTEEVLAAGPSPTPFIRVNVKNAQGNPVAVQRISKANCSSGKCTQSDAKLNASSADFPGGTKKSGGRIADNNLKVIGVTPSAPGYNYPGCLIGTANAYCYVWDAWTTGRRGVTYIVATPTPSTNVSTTPTVTPGGPTRTPTPSPTRIPSPTITPTTTQATPTSIPLPTSATFVSATMKYDQWGNVYETIDTRGGVTTTNFDATHTLPVKVIQPRIAGQGRWETTTDFHSILGKPETVTDINGVQTQIRYDSLGRVRKIWGPNESRDIPAVRADYGDGSPTWVKTETLVDKTSQKYLASVSFYNGLGQKIEEQSQWENNKRKVSYTSFTSLGQAQYSVVPFLDDGGLGGFINDNRVKNPPNDKKTSTTYDMLGRVVTMKNPDGTSINTDYAGTVTTIFDANDPQKTGHNRKVTTADAFGASVKVDEYKNGALFITQSFEYDKAGRLKKTTDPGGHQSVYTYNILGKKTKEKNSDSGLTQYAYDEIGNLIAKKDNKGQLIRMSYDNINRIKTRTYPDGSLVAYTYDEGSNQKGKLTTVAYNGTTTKYTYDTEGQLIQENKVIAGDPATYSTNYAYDSAKRLATITYPADASGAREVVTQTYTISSLPNTLSSTLGNLITSSVYNKQGQLTTRTFANNTTLSQEYYDANFRLKSITLNSSTAEIPEQGTVAGIETVSEDPSFPTPTPIIERKKVPPPYLFPLSDILSFVNFLHTSFLKLTSQNGN